MVVRSPGPRRGQRGQVLPIAAILSTLLIGATALAVDLSIAEAHHRDLQNAADAAGLAGARDLGRSNGGQPNQADRLLAVTDALRVVYDHMGWGAAGTTWATDVVKGQTAQDCGPGASAHHCDVTTTGPGSDGATVQVTVNVPPLTAANAAYNESAAVPGSPWGYIEVAVRRTDRSAFAGVLGFGTNPSGARAIGYHLSGGQGFGFALYTGTIATSGNTNEVVDGNVYAYRDLQPQSLGQASICANTDSAGNLGHVILGAPQSGPFPVPDPAAGAPYQAQLQPLTNVASCAGLGGGALAQTAPLGSCGSLTVQAAVLSTTQDPGSRACMANPPLAPPDLQGPSQSGNVVRLNGSALGAGQSVLTVTLPLTPGLYIVTHNPNCVAPGCTDVVIDAGAPANCPLAYLSTFQTCLLGVTFELDQGATIGVNNKATVLISPYVPLGSQDPNDGHFPIYAPLGSAAGLYLSKNGTTLAATGTVYLPSGTISVTQNAIIQIHGQAIVNSWQMQSGNHMGSDVIYDPTWAASEREVLQLAQ